MLIRPSFRTKPVQLGERIALNPKHPLTKNLKFAYCFTAGSLKNFGYYPYTATFGANGGWSRDAITGLLGAGASDNSTNNQYVQVSDAAGNFMGDAPKTILAGGYIHGTGGSNSCSFIGDRNGTPPYNTLNYDDLTGGGQLVAGSVSHLIPFLDHANFPLYADLGWMNPGDTGAHSNPFFIANNWKRDKLYVDMTGGVFPIAAYSAGNPTWIGRGRDANAREVYGNWKYLLVLDVPLERKWARSLGHNPWQVWQ